MLYDSIYTKRPADANLSVEIMVIVNYSSIKLLFKKNNSRNTLVLGHDEHLNFIVTVIGC